MSCLNPKRMIPYPSTHPNFGQYRLVKSLDYDKLFCNSGEYFGFSYEGELLETILVPCRKCRGCLLDKSKDWATRMVLESKTQEHCYFVTLTYRDDDSVLYRPSSGNGAMSLSKDHIQSFIKNFRRQADYHYGVGSGIRYFVAGEYGPQSERPHYHMILYGFDFDDTKVIGRNFRGESYYDSDFLSSIWDRGYVCIAPLTYETCAYTARYTLKKADGLDKEYWESLGVLPEFQLQSTRPGLGYDFFLQHYQEIFQRGQIVLDALSKDVQNVNKIPQYFIRKLSEIDPDLFTDYRDKKKKQALDRVHYRYEEFRNEYLSRFGISFDENYLHDSFERREQLMFSVQSEHLSDGMSKFLRTI